MDSLRHSGLTRPHAGSWRKLASPRASMKARCSAGVMVLTVMLTPQTYRLPRVDADRDAETQEPGTAIRFVDKSV